MACLTSLEQDTADGGWKGVALKTGEVKKFNTLEDYKRYTKSLEQQGTYCPPIEPNYNIKYQQGKSTQHTGFLEFRVRDPEKQAKYSAMSSTWEGVASSEAAVARGDYSLDSADLNRDYLRKGTVPAPPIPVPASNIWESPATLWNELTTGTRQSCVIQ